MSTNNLEKSSMALLCLHIDSKYKKKANGYFAQNFKYLTGPRLSHNPIVGQMVATATGPRQREAKALSVGISGGVECGVSKSRPMQA
jgi:hypothetical protein